MISARRLRVQGVPTSLRANYPFGRYRREDAHPVRQLDVTGQSYLEQARRTRQMLREMTPAKALEVIEFRRGLNFFQALTLAKQEGRIIVPNDVHDRILTETKDRELLKQLYKDYVWTGTLVIYEKPDKPFGKRFTFKSFHNGVNYSVSFQIPEQFQGKANCALVIEHPDFDLLDLGDDRYKLKFDVHRIRLIQDFPKKNGWYMQHAETGVPHGIKVKESSGARSLLRVDVRSYLGPVARCVDIDVDDFGRGQLVVADFGSSFGLGVALVPLNVTPEKSDSHD